MSIKKKVGIVTLQGSNNYGAMYQVYALSRYIESLGCEVFVLNCHMETATLYTYFKNPISSIRKIISRKALSLDFLRKRTQYYKGIKREDSFVAAFDDFRAKYLTITDSFYNYDMLVKKCPEADVFITGSDQVWAADFLFSKPTYLLGFVPDNIKKISYAPSFGKQQLEPYLHKVFKKHIQKFDAISARESGGVDIVKNVAGLNAIKVLDPTLLIEDYSEIIDYSLVPESEYILVYRLHQEHDLAIWMAEMINQIGAAMNIPIYSVSTNCPWGINTTGEDLYPTPTQLLGLIEKSSLVLTNSFHGTVFSLLFRTKFLTFARDKYSDKQNLRMTELLSSVGLSTLFCEPLSELDDLKNKIDYDYSYDSVHADLNRLRKVSIDFLNESLL